jgi:hypothetical protein
MYIYIHLFSKVMHTLIELDSQHQKKYIGKMEFAQYNI